jgi:cytochrome bd-type quinol oxidase subunit 2
MVTSTRKTQSAPQPEPPVSKSEPMRQLADQLATVFVVALFCIWLAVTRPEATVQTERMAWWYFVILSAFALFLWLFMLRKKDISLKRRWGFFCVVIAYIWATYFISGVSFGCCFFKWLAIGLLVWSALIVLAMGLIIIGWGAKGNQGKVIKWAAKQGDSLHWPLLVLVVFASIFFGWKMLSDTGTQYWWLTPLLYIGVIVFIVIALIYAWTSHSKRKM